MATKDGFEYRQLQMEDYLLMVSAEQREQTEVYARRRIASDDDAITDNCPGGISNPFGPVP